MSYGVPDRNGFGAGGVPTVDDRAIAAVRLLAEAVEVRFGVRGLVAHKAYSPCTISSRSRRAHSMWTLRPVPSTSTAT